MSRKKLDNIYLVSSRGGSSGSFPGRPASTPTPAADDSESHVSIILCPSLLPSKGGGTGISLRNLHLVLLELVNAACRD
ncbi:hypothetical protein CEXT_119131 [Caerostris extrusa]|uniref:Uncharacterized protein n=1 Tax=Caerostris extrusa TaxID=172846 RepID=A0AAV4PSM8_CAEEX|nr:hypothetical protein CEXT_119131 [Caerostris extrusa]